MVIGAGSSSARVSVVIGAYNAERYLAETVRSVLDQTRPVDEVIVVDDGCTDATVSIARAFGSPVAVIEADHGGAGAARNIGIAAATGSIIGLCDADDLWLPTKIEAQLTVLDARAGNDPGRAVAVFCDAKEFVSPDIQHEYGGRAPRNHVERARLSSALLATRSTFERVGPFGAGTTDWLEWCSRLGQEADEVHHIPTVLVRRRLHLNNSTLASAHRVAMVPAIAAHLKRRREQS